MKRLAFLLAWLCASTALGTVYLGDIIEDDTIHFMWHTSGTDGASITRATDGVVSVYKDNGLTQTTTGVTDTEDFDTNTGIHVCTIVLTDAFYVAGANYTVVLSAATIDGVTVNAVLAHFSIENRFDEVDVVQLGGVVQSATDLKDFADEGYDPATDKMEGVKLADTTTTNTDMLTAAAVNGEVVDVLRTDVNTLPGQVAPTNTPTFEEAIMFLYKAWRNKKEQTGTEFSLYNDAGAVVDQKATVSDDGTTTTVEEIVTGP